MLASKFSIVKALANRRTIARIAILVSGSVAMLNSSAHAGIITAGVYAPAGTAGTATATVVSSSPNFDITSTDKSFKSVGTLDFQFPVNPSGGTVTYLVTEGVTNNTTSTWTDYHEQLGKGETVSFALGNTPVQFLLPPDASYTNPSFPTRSVTSDDIDYTSGAILPGQSISMTFSITVPDAASRYVFTLRQFPTVPEPGTLSVLALGSIGLLSRRRHR